MTSEDRVASLCEQIKDLAKTDKVLRTRAAIELQKVLNNLQEEREELGVGLTLNQNSGQPMVNEKARPRSRAGKLDPLNDVPRTGHSPSHTTLAKKTGPNPPMALPSRHSKSLCPLPTYAILFFIQPRCSTALLVHPA